MRIQYLQNQQKLGSRARDALAYQFTFKDASKGETFYRNYQMDIPSFEIFQESAPWQNFVAAYISALQAPTDYHPINIFNSEHATQWLSFCKAQMGSP
jgi:hypothetical protein